MNKGKKQIGKLLAVVVAICILTGYGPSVLAAETVQDTDTVRETGNAAEAVSYGSGTIMKTEKKTAMKAEPEKTAETLMTFEKGSLVFVIEETADGWCRVRYQDVEGYVEKEGLSVQEIDIEGLDAEMAANEAETKFVIEVVEKYRADARRSKIWGTIIILLVAGIFGIGIVSAVRSNKSGDNEEDEENRNRMQGKTPAAEKKDRNGRKKRGSKERKKRELKIEDFN